MSAAADGAVRVEHDLLGEREVPAGVYWGIHTLRALENFSASGTPISRYPELVVALATVKQAAAAANRDLGVLTSEKAEAIIAACQDIRDGALHDQFVVDSTSQAKRWPVLPGASHDYLGSEAPLTAEILGFAREWS